MSHAQQLYLFETQRCTQVGEVEVDGLDVYFPPEVRGWAEVLDCRIPPYTDQTLEENCEYALGVRKFYILVSDAQLPATAPSADG